MDSLLIKKIETEQEFANAVYSSFKEIKYGIASCCYVDFIAAVFAKEICDWQNFTECSDICFNTVGLTGCSTIIEPESDVCTDVVYC